MTSDPPDQRPSSTVPADLVALLTLDEVDTDTFEGLCPPYSWGRVYGGQVVAQAFRAAAATVPATHLPHSLHANFILGGKPGEVIRYEVDRIRDGRSFMTRRVVARQAGGAILNLDASFHAPEDDADSPGRPLPQILPQPDQLEPTVWENFGDVRVVPLTRATEPARSVMWIRAEDHLGDDPVVHACALAYLSDHNPMDAIVAAHPRGLAWDELMSASLDHALWIHRPFRLACGIRIHRHGTIRGRAGSTRHQGLQGQVRLRRREADIGVQAPQEGRLRRYVQAVPTRGSQDLQSQATTSSG